MDIEQSPRCPVCKAKFRGTQECLRCGADLTALMILLLKAAGCRRSAIKAIGKGEFEKACNLATEAQKVHATQKGGRLCLLTSWLTWKMQNRRKG